LFSLATSPYSRSEESVAVEGAFALVSAVPHGMIWISPRRPPPLSSQKEQKAFPFVILYGEFFFPVIPAFLFSLPLFGSGVLHRSFKFSDSGRSVALPTSF